METNMVGGEGGCCCGGGEVVGCVAHQVVYRTLHARLTTVTGDGGPSWRSRLPCHHHSSCLFPLPSHILKSGGIPPGSTCPGTATIRPLHGGGAACRCCRLACPHCCLPLLPHLRRHPQIIPLLFASQRALPTLNVFFYFTDHKSTLSFI